MKFIHGILAGLVALSLNGCGLFDHGSTAAQRANITPGPTITVDGKQNIYALAQANNVSMRDIIILNNLHEPFWLKPGQSLVLPAGASGAGTGTVSGAAVTAAESSGSMMAAPLSAIETQSLPPPPAPVPFKAKAASSAPVEALNAPAVAPPKPIATTTPVPAAAAPEAVAAEAPSMIWPVQGPILSAYGPKGQGVSNEGVNIGAPKGSPVVAAANGIVVYAGNEMKGFGNLILIRHEGGWVTAYAYLDRMMVQKDAVVAQGDMIGTVGKSGNVSSPQLHFETRHEGKTVDPNGVVKG